MSDETWESKKPNLWAAVMLGYPEGWGKMTVFEIETLEKKRTDEGLCAFCASSLDESEESVDVMPPRPLAGPFCSPLCADNHLFFYCQREGK